MNPLLKHCLEGFEIVPPGLTIVDQALIQVYFNRYNILITLFTYVLPLIVITLTTIHMSHVLWGRPPPGEINQQLQLSIKKKKKVRTFSFLNARIQRDPQNRYIQDSKVKTYQSFQIFLVFCYFRHLFSQILPILSNPTYSP